MTLVRRVALRHAQGIHPGPERGAEVGLQQAALHTVHADEHRQPLGKAAFQGRGDDLAGTDLGIGRDPVFEVEDDGIRAVSGGLLDHLGAMTRHKEEAAQDPRRARHGL